MTALIALVEGPHLWCSTGVSRRDWNSLDELWILLRQEINVSGAQSLRLVLTGFWKDGAMLWTPQKELLPSLEAWQGALNCRVEVQPLSWLARSVSFEEHQGLWFWLGDSLEAVWATPQGLRDLKIGHWPLLEDRQCRCGGRGHADAFGSVHALRRACDAHLPAHSLEELWSQREASLLAPIWGKALGAIASVVVTALSLDDSLCHCQLCGPLAELEDFADELGDVVYPLLPRGVRRAVELRQGPSTIDLLRG